MFLRSELSDKCAGLNVCNYRRTRNTQTAEGHDEKGAVQWKWEFNRLTEGVADIAQIVDDLKAVGYEGYLSLEDFSPGEDDDKVKEQGAYLKNLIE